MIVVPILFFSISVISAIVSYILIRIFAKRGDKGNNIPSRYEIVFSANKRVNIPELSKSTLYLHQYNFESASGDMLDPMGHLLFKVHGSFMQDYGVFNDNLIFCNQIFNTSKVDSFPLVVIKIHENVDSAEEDCAESYTYYLRRAWRVIHLESDDVNDVIRKLIHSSEFDDIYSRPECFSARKLESDFMELLEEYKKKESNVFGKSVICTGHFGNKIALEIYPATDVMGDVVASFDLHSL